MNKIQAVIVADSVDTRGNRITSFLLTYPRFIHSELMTHRMFSRNSASSRAIPFEKMVKMVEEDPFIPIAVQRDHKGMQGTQYLDETQYDCFKMEWLAARDSAIRHAKWLNTESFTTKQLCNRLLEPFMWHTTLVTATELNGFFELRCPKYEYYLESYGEEPEIKEYFHSKKDIILKYGNAYVKDLYQTRPRREVKDFEDIHWRDCNHSQAEIHIQALAEAMWDARNESTPTKLTYGQWHLPFNDKIDTTKIDLDYDDGTWLFKTARIKIATARCARLSYNNHDGEIDYQKDIELHDKLLKSKHASPMEHCAQCQNNDKWYANFKGWKSYRKFLEEDNLL